MVQISDVGEKISLNQIENIEARLGFKLSEDYKQFLLINNGGRPDPDTIDVEGDPYSPTDVQIFFSVESRLESSNILWNFEVFIYNGGCKNMLPIACDSGGNLFCLKIANGLTTEVMYYPTDIAVPKYYKVANNFSEFTGKLRPWID